MPFQFTGFADEAEKSLDGQISTLKEVGWSAIELRLLDGKNVINLTDDEWSATKDKLQAGGIKVVGFGGAIANWSRPITNDFQVDIDELKRVAPRMREVDTKFLRVMSYPNPEDNPMSKDEYRNEVIRRFKELAKIAEDENVILAHENCSGYGADADGWLDMVESVNSPALQGIMDTGNNSLHEKDVEATWRYYEKCRETFTHVHVKCAKPGPDGGDYVTCYVEEDPVQERILRDLYERGYDGWLSIEPHIKAAIHAGQDVDDSGDGRKVWVDFAKRLEKMVADIVS